MSARSRALIPLSAEQQAAMQAVAVTEQRRRQGRTLSAWPYATAFFRCLNGSRRISLTDLRFFAPALTKEEFHGNRLLWLAAVDKLIESFGEVCVLPAIRMRGIVCSRPFLFVKVSGVVRKPR